MLAVAEKSGKGGGGDEKRGHGRVNRRGGISSRKRRFFFVSRYLGKQKAGERERGKSTTSTPQFESTVWIFVSSQKTPLWSMSRPIGFGNGGAGRGGGAQLTLIL
jgi:hypothetical protein